MKTKTAAGMMPCGGFFFAVMDSRSVILKSRDMGHTSPVLPGRAPSFLCLPKERKQRKGTPNKLALTGSLAAVFSSGRDENSLRSDIRPGKPQMKTPPLGVLEGGEGL